MSGSKMIARAYAKPFVFAPDAAIGRVSKESSNDGAVNGTSCAAVTSSGSKEHNTL